MDTQEDYQGQDTEEAGLASDERTRRISHVVTDNYDGTGTTRIVTTVGSSESNGDAASQEDVENIDVEEEYPR
eukprot:4629242-Heterocapsa_arctica.AAC.1